MKKFTKKLFFTLLFCTILPFTVSAHSGRTDSSGGHHDYKNVSGLGSYHYHHGYEAHLHPNGICPYESTSVAAMSTQNTFTSTPTIENKYTDITDIKAYINHIFIPSYSYNDTNYIVAESLDKYGFDVNWNDTERILTIQPNPNKKITASDLSNPTSIQEIKTTDIEVKLYSPTTGCYETIQSYNIGGETIIPINTLGGTVTWNDSNRTIFVALTE